MIMALFKSTTHSTRYKLFKSFCMSVYGSQLWNFESDVCERFYVTWRKCVRRLLNLPYRTHRRHVHMICKDLPVDFQMHMRFIKFVNVCMESPNNLVKTLFRTARHNFKSTVCSSLSALCTIEWLLKQCYYV
jgi:hypothetical protein